jgi:hypothetical protein
MIHGWTSGRWLMGSPIGGILALIYRLVHLPIFNEMTLCFLL